MLMIARLLNDGGDVYIDPVCVRVLEPCIEEDKKYPNGRCIGTSITVEVGDVCMRYDVEDQIGEVGNKVERMRSSLMYMKDGE